MQIAGFRHLNYVLFYLKRFRFQIDFIQLEVLSV
jgi:hypothetical protein